MEPAATPFLVGRDPPPPANTAHLAEGQVPAPSGWARRAFQRTLSFLLACPFAWALHRAGCDLGLAVVITYGLATLCVRLWKLERLRRDNGGDHVATVRERRRVGHAAWIISLAMGSNVALHVASAVPQSLAFRVALRVLAGIAMGFAFYFLFAGRRTDASADGDEHWPEKDLEELTPEKSA